jgi:putative ABC transport system permease protein
MTPRFLSLFWRQTVRPSWRHPLLTGLNILSIALGVAVFLAIRIANQAALESFRSAAGLTSGKTHLEIRGNLADGVFPAVRATPGVRAATPLVEGIVTRPDQPGEYLRILGIDPFTGAEFFAFSLEQPGSDFFPYDHWLGDPTAIAVQPAAHDLGPRVRVLANGQDSELTPRFVLKPDGLLSAVDKRIVAMDIGWAQELLGLPGRLTAIQVLLDDPAEAAAVIERLRPILPADATLTPPSAREDEMAAMLSAFQLNLTAMSLVSLVVGMFLIFNSVGATVVRRRPEIAILRACGTTRTEVRALFLGGALADALVGSLLGVACAPALARLASPALASSISSLYEVIRLDHLVTHPGQVTLAVGVGLAAALIAAWRPASEAARCEPARILHPGAAADHFTPLRWRGLVIATVLLAAAVGLSFRTLHGGPKQLGFVAAGAVLAGFSLLVPWLTAAVAACFRPAGGFLKMASDHLVRSLHRNAVTVAALAAAVAMTISVTVMIHSFRASVERWIHHTLVADLYIAPAANDIVGPQSFLPEEATAWAAERTDVQNVATFREMPLRFRDAATTLAVIEGRGRGDLVFLEGSLPEAAAAFSSGRAVAVSESFSTRFGVGGGDGITLPTPTGEHRFAVCGVYRDFTRDRGTVMMTRGLFRRHWPGDERIHSLGLKLAPGADPNRLAEDFRDRFGRDGQFVIHDNASLRARIFEIFDQTFAVTSVLRIIAIVVAVAGVLFSFSVLVIEREREIGVLRALGASRFQVAVLFLTEAGLLGLTASLSGLVSGSALAVILTGVINKAFFGWTIELTFPVSTLLTTPLWLIPAVVLAALLPAWRAAALRPAQAVRFE